MEFNLTRFGNLIKRDLILYRKSILFGVLGIFGLLLMLYGFGRLSEDSNGVTGDFWKHICLAFVFIIGLIFTSIVFREFNTPGGRLQFLSLPASNFEKLASRWLYSLIIFPVFIVLSVWIVSKITIIRGPGLFENFGREEASYIIVGFMILHATMLLYAVWFNKLVAVKSTIVGLVVTIITAFIMVGLFWLVFREFFEGSTFRAGPMQHVNMDAAGQEFFITKIEPLGDFLLKFFVAPFLWIVSYFKMKEKEA